MSPNTQESTVPNKMYDYYKQYCKSNYMRIGRSMVGLVSYILRNALNPRKKRDDSFR